MIEYDHAKNLHTLAGPQAALPFIFAEAKPHSLLDVGCGTGTWLKASLDYGIKEVFGVDGVAIPPERLRIPLQNFAQADLTRPLDLKRTFDYVLCLEVVEHLDPQFAKTLIASLVRHAKRIVFAAACPGQPGQHHVNCQWPAFWQELFNAEGFSCEDSVRWQIWSNDRIEPWYRQNIFTARMDSRTAGREQRLRPVVHPEMFGRILTMYQRPYRNALRQKLETGSVRTFRHTSTFIRGLFARALGRRSDLK
jgi:SAM-dependent methyltransferase